MKTEQQREAEELLRTLGLAGRRGWFPTYIEFTDAFSPEWYARIGAFFGHPMHADMVAMMEFMYPVFIANQAGGYTFKLTPQLALQLRDTDVPDVPCELLKLPFEGIFLDVDAGTFAPPAHQVTRIVACHIPGDRFRLTFDTRDGNSSYVNFDLGTPDASVAELVQETRARVAHERVEAKEHIKGLGDDDLYDDYFKSDVFRMTISALLYIASPDADVERDMTEVHRLHTQLQGLRGGRRRSKLEEQLRAAKSNTVYIVGGRTKLDAGYQADAALRSSAEGRKILKRFRVRGHFAKQAHGEGRSLRKVIWRAPYWKGPTYAEMVERGYVVR